MEWDDRAVALLDYGAGNVRSCANAVRRVGLRPVLVSSAAAVADAPRLIFPGVGAFGACMAWLHARGLVEPLRAYIASGRPFLGICLGLQTLCAASDESPEVPGLGIVPARVHRIDAAGRPVPHIGWNGVRRWTTAQAAPALLPTDATAPGTRPPRFYFVHSYAAMPAAVADAGWALTVTDYGGEFVSSMQRGAAVATQFHPEKSAAAGLGLIERFLSMSRAPTPSGSRLPLMASDDQCNGVPTQLARRIIACLDVRSNDDGDLVVTKGDRYDVRDRTNGAVRNLGRPVEVAARYYADGADEIVFLNITSFRNSPLRDQPMLEVLRRTSESVFVPLTVGGGICDHVDPDGTKHSAIEVAGEYFRAGADKVSIGSDAVYAAEAHMQLGGVRTGTTSIEQISRVYGSQAVVISVDPMRVYVQRAEDTPHRTIRTRLPGPNGECYCWFQCTVHGGRQARDLDVHQLVQACEALGAGEILLNCIDRDGTNSGFDIELVEEVKRAVAIPVIASSGAGSAAHFGEVFLRTGVDAALAAGVFHRGDVRIADAKSHCAALGIPIRL